MRPEPVAGSPAADAEAQEEIRQMLEAKSARSEARGDGPIDVDAEMAALTAAVRPSRRSRRCARRSASWWWPATSAGCAGARSPWTWRPRSSASSQRLTSRAANPI